MFQLTLFSVPSLLAMGLALAQLRRVWRQRAAHGGLALAVMIAAVAWWSLGQFVGTLQTTLEGKFLASQWQYLGIVTVPTAWFVFALRYTGTFPALARRWPLLLPIPVVTLALAATNGWHGWLWESARLVEHGGFVAWEIDYGPWFPWLTAWSYALVGGGTAILLAALLASPWHRRRAAAMVAAPLLVMATNALYLLPDSPIAWIDITPLGFALAGGVLAFALRGDVLDLVPLSRERVVEDMPDAVFVITHDGRLIDLNPAGERLLRRDERDALGRLLTDLLPVPRDLVDAGDVRPRDLLLRLDGRETAWRVSASDLLDPRGESTGRVLLFHDHSDRWRAERELRATSESLMAANEELERLATLDPLTRALNRRSFLRLADEELARARRNARDLALIVFRIVDLGRINDEHGSDAGDVVLAGAARLLEAMRRDGDLLGRTGAGEFTLLLPEASERRARDLATSIRRTLLRSRFRSPADEPIDVDIATGAAVLGDAPERAEQLLRRALDTGRTDPEALRA